MNTASPTTPTIVIGGGCRFGGRTGMISPRAMPSGFTGARTPIDERDRWAARGVAIAEIPVGSGSRRSPTTRRDQIGRDTVLSERDRAP
jgi:hypothetical protein